MTKVSEYMYDWEIHNQSQTVDQPTTLQGNATELSHKTSIKQM